jgi:16S rRNA (guanine527-N7)-methyltransferase
MVDPDFETPLVAACGSFGVQLAPEQIELMWRHFCLARETNEKFNLTRITNVRRAAVEHYADSLTLLPWLDRWQVKPRRALDVGTGGGWPAVPLAIMLPETHWTAIDSTGKKARFVADAAARLGLANLAIQHTRAHELAGKAEPFDLVVCRAVAKLPDLVLETRHLLAPGGYLVCYKTPEMTREECLSGNCLAARVHLVAQQDLPITLTAGDETFQRLLLSYRR